MQEIKVNKVLLLPRSHKKILLNISLLDELNHDEKRNEFYGIFLAPSVGLITYLIMFKCVLPSLTPTKLTNFSPTGPTLGQPGPYKVLES